MNSSEQAAVTILLDIHNAPLISKRILIIHLQGFWNRSITTKPTRI